MISIFPGMDPYLEQEGTWSDFHTTFFMTIRKRLNATLPHGYVARIDRYVWIHEPEARDRILLGKPDVYVAESDRGKKGESVGTLLKAPAVSILPAIRKEGERYLKVLDLQRRRVVTVVEILSPSNKQPGANRDAYLMKRNEYLATGVNLIELDLLRSWPRMPMGEPSPPPAPYYVLVQKAWEWPRLDIWPISLRQALPPLPVPLDREVAEVTLDLQSCFAEAFAEGRYREEFDYRQPPAPPLQEPDATWAREWITEKLGEARS
jgi:hypothetical protein